MIREWRWVGTARDERALDELARTSTDCAFDIDITRLLLRLYNRSPSRFMPLHECSADARSPT